MSTAVRSYLVAGAAAATATAIALAPVQVTPHDIAVPAHPTSAQPQLSEAMVDLLAAASRMTAAVTPKLPGQTGAPAFGAAPAAAATGDVSVQNAASDWLTSAYQFIQYWVDYGVELADWVLGWIPGGYLIGDQINIFYGSLIRPIADSVFYDLIVPVLNAPLNLGVWANGIGDIAGATVNSLISLGVNEFNYFFGWIIPPLPLPPFPPFPGLATTQTLTASLAAPTLRDIVGNVVLPPADFVTDLAVNTIDGGYGLVHNTTGFLVDGADNVFDALRLNFISRQIDINYKLISSLSNEAVGLTTDLIQVPDRYLNDVLNHGQGVFQAIGTEAQFVGNSITDHGSNAINAVGNYVDDQINYFTPGFAATNTKEVTSVPPSARASLLSPAPVDETPVKEAVDSPAKGTRDLAGAVGAAQDRAKDRAANVRSRIQTGVKDAVGAAKQAGDDTRDAAKAAVKNLTPKANTKDKANTASVKAKHDKDNSGKKTKKAKHDKK